VATLKRSIELVSAVVILAATAAAQTAITDVVNAASRIGSGLPGSGIAQGALFAITGRGLGPDPPMQAAFPLPTTGGLGGVTVTINAGGTPVNAIMVYVSATEVDAILPSSTPLGPATVTLNNGGSTAASPIMVVPSAFGIFAGAGVFNIAGDGTAAVNSPYQSAQAAQTVMINGTGLGAITSDETQSGATGVPNTSITVWVGTTQATVVSAGRGACCGGISPSFPIPQGIAAWDVIAFTIPDGVQGCQVSVTVQTGGFVSNSTRVAVAPGGGTCPEAAGLNGGNPVIVSGMVKTGLVTMLHTVTPQSLGSGAVNTTTDSATAVFIPVDFGPNPVPIPSYSAQLQASAGSCSVTATRFDRSIPVVIPPNPTPPPVAPALLDAGPALNLTGPKGAQAMKKQSGIYNATAVISTLSIPGLPPTTSGGPAFLAPGQYTLDNGSGGADIGPFSATLRNPTPVNWDNMAQTATVNRAQGVTVKWSGGDPDGVVAIGGVSGGTQGTVTYFGSFTCYAQVSAGQFTVPPFITQQLPPSGTAAQGGLGTMVLVAIIADLITIPGVDVTYYFSQQSAGGSVTFQ
jgi:uncharacterized protein (TIGR03437 family)